MLNNDPYSTLIPVIETVGMLLKPKRILELGAGVYSTPKLCDPFFFPQVEYIHSYEPDPVWVKHAKKYIDPSVKYIKFYTKFREPFLDRIESLDLEQYDFLIVDNGVSLEERRDCIALVAKQVPMNALVLIHDFEHLAYQRAADPFEHLMVYTHQYPQTALVWNGERLSPQEVSEITATALMERVY